MINFPLRLRPAARALLAFLLFGVLAACGFDTATPDQAAQTGGGSSPELVAQYFFEDLRRAFKDPQQLATETKRDQWVERLANYFAPIERDDQRVALNSALENFVSGRSNLDQNESLTLDVRFDKIEKVSDDGDRALVRPTNGSIYILITRSTNNGVFTLYEDDVPLTKIIGDPSGAVPVIRIGRSWFLTEG